MGEPPRPARKGESAIEKQIREAIERGDFDHLPGSGKPLDLSENPYTPPDWRLSFKILQDAGMAPDWIELDKEIRRELPALDAWFKQQAQWQIAQRDRARRLPADKLIPARERLAELDKRICAEYRQRATLLNRLIDIYNLKAPRADLHRERIRLEEAIQKFRDVCSG
jgi:DnaJ homolog subfamily C member 28